MLMMRALWGLLQTPPKMAKRSLEQGHAANPADADDAHPLGAAHSKICKSIAWGSVDRCGHSGPDAILGSSTGGPEPRHTVGNSCKTRALPGKPPHELRGLVKNEGPMKQGRRHWRSCLSC